MTKFKIVELILSAVITLIVAAKAIIKIVEGFGKFPKEQEA